VARNAATALSPTVTGWAFSVAALGLPFFIAGGIKILYDLLVFVSFRGLRPPEEVHRGAAEPPGSRYPRRWASRPPPTLATWTAIGCANISRTSDATTTLLVDSRARFRNGRTAW